MAGTGVDRVIDSVEGVSTSVMSSGRSIAKKDKGKDDNVNRPQRHRCICVDGNVFCACVRDRSRMFLAELG
jgi:hypothetical protein